ncbi:putative toxin-antitoxin system toxin component, PIN family [Accumulibacter sp.]|uniref:putative toxin-antitoxin system toxin component, PIN family n=1 Tax=Accumulibacter sp. TaxID=2053492 RepID=UPI002609270C|nr:putative toxin-antitoxin system toxin component, PIN family [Accumulibacter sp.]
MSTEAMRVVLDTNIVIDLLHFADPRTATLRRAIDGGAVQCYVDQPCLAELERVTAYPSLALGTARQQALLAAYRRWVIACEADGVEDYSLPLCRDRDDQKFLVLAARCHADLLITRDRRLLSLIGRGRSPPAYGIVTAEVAAYVLTQGPPS